MKKVLVLYKKTVFSLYKEKNVKVALRPKSGLLKSQWIRLIKADEEHTNTLNYIKLVLKKYSVSAKFYFRGGRVPFDEFDTIITVGGDGTFLRAAASTQHQLILGVNSSLSFSVGRFCVANINNFDQVIQKMKTGKYIQKNLQRLFLSLDNGKEKVNVMNDILIAHSNPAVLSRYIIKIDKKQEEQRSSGVWISTAMGSSGAIHSAGGKLLNPYSTDIQYLPRELYAGLNKPYQLKGGVLNRAQSIKIASLMPQGNIYIDGANKVFPFSYGQELHVSLSKFPVQTILL
ncbi:MAG: NAD(+)/NADH kinase [Candidatus Omnitrophica bacterium]|nr:NAD(+)/NADH kinase [Candidatus Omnitrophota bacterium]